MVAVFLLLIISTIIIIIIIIITITQEFLVLPVAAINRWRLSGPVPPCNEKQGPPLVIFKHFMTLKSFVPPPPKTAKVNKTKKV